MLGDHEWVVANVETELGREFALGFGLVEGNGLQAELANSLSRLGRWTESFEILDRAIRFSGEEALFTDTPDVVMFGWALTMVRTGRLDEARRYLQSAWKWAVPVMTHDSMALTSVRAALARLEGDILESREAVNHLLDRISGHFLAMSGEPVALAIAFEADEAFRHRRPTEDVIALADHWIAKLESCLVDAPGRVNLADFGMFLGQCRAERARLAGDDDPARWEQLAETWHSLPRPYEAAYARFRAAWALLMGPSAASHQDRQRATTLLVLAKATSQELGAIYLERDIESLWQTAGLKQERPAVTVTNNGTKSPVGPKLTARELQVLALMARGDSNGRIAIALDISTRTAAVHVSNIIHKFGASTRVEAAMRARDLGLV